MELSSLAPLALAAGYVYNQQQEYEELITKVQKSIQQQEQRNLELQDHINQQMEQLYEDLHEELSHTFANDIDKILECTNAEAHLSGMGDKFWMAAFWVTLHNTSKSQIILSGIRMEWRVAGFQSIWMPYYKGTLYINPGGYNEIRLVGAYNKKLFDTKAERQAVKKIAKEDGTGECNLLLVGKAAEYSGVKDMPAYLKNIELKVESHGNRVYKGGKNGATLDFFNTLDDPQKDK